MCWANTRWAVEAERVAQARSRYLDEENSRNAIGVDLSGGEGQGLSQRQLDELVGRVIERGARPVLFFTPAEQRQLNFLHKSHGNRVLPFIQDDLAGSAALLANCRALIACNTELLHLARAICRRAERRIVALSKDEPLSPVLISYINRLSDLLFTLARAVNQRAGIEEIPW